MKIIFSHLSACLLLTLTCVPSLGQTTITLDPEMDNVIYEGANTSSNGSGAYFMCGKSGNNDAGRPLRRSLIKFDIVGNLPVGNLVITDARLDLYLHKSAGRVDNVDISLHKLFKDWGEGSSESGNINGGDGQGEGNGEGAPASNGEATWEFAQYHEEVASQVPWNNLGGDFDAFPTSTITVDQTLGTKSWTGLEDDVQAMLDDPNNNFGWILIGEEVERKSMRKFRSREHPDGETPKLVITFIDLGVPIELLQFEAKSSENQHIQLAWSTASERSHSHFVVERSSNNQDYQALGQVSSAGFSTSQKNYQFVDFFPNVPVNYYRLKSVDVNGTFTYSHVERVQHVSSFETQIRIYPNPLSQEEILSFETQHNGKNAGALLEIMDLMGNRLISRPITLQKGKQVHKISMQYVAKGTYILRLISDQHIHYEPIVVQF